MKKSKLTAALSQDKHMLQMEFGGYRILKINI